MRFAVETHGCRLNQAETDAIAAWLSARGHEQVGIEDAQLYVLNSCAITHAADADARAAVRRARRRNPEARIVLTGCHANAEPELLAGMAELDALVGNAEKRGPALADMLEEIAAAGPRDPARAEAGPELVAVERLTRRLRPDGWGPARDLAWDLGPAAAPARTRPLLKVQDGCDYQCSFCIVPQVRGRSRSATIERAGEELRGLLDAGAPEVVLTGAHLGTWGRDLGMGAGAGQGAGQGAAGRPGISTLLAALREACPSARLRLGSLDPHEVDETLVGMLAAGVDEDGAGLCQHLHLPVQSGDDEVLRAMRRAHTAADLEGLLPRLRAAAPDIGLGTDIIVGFPGETDAAFERSVALFELAPLPFAHVFVWSPRRGTAAVSFADRVTPEVAARRSAVLRERAARGAREFLAAQLGQLRSAVILRRRDRRTGRLRALTDNYISVDVEGPDAVLGRRAWIRLVATDDRADGPVRVSGELVDVARQADAAPSRHRSLAQS